MPLRPCGFAGLLCRDGGERDRGLSLAVTELTDETKAPITFAEFHTLTMCLDYAITQAVTEYGRRREQSIADEGTERLGRECREERTTIAETSAVTTATIARFAFLAFRRAPGTVVARVR